MKYLAFILALFFAPLTLHAAADITLTPKSSTPTSITVTVRNNGASGTSTSTGTYYSIFNGVAYAVNPQNNPDNSASIAALTGGQSKDITITGLNSNTVYTFHVQESGFYTPNTFIKKVTIATLQSATAVTCTPPKTKVNGSCQCQLPYVTNAAGACVAPPPQTTTTTNANGTTTTTTTTVVAGDQCTDEQDNDGDGRADHYGVPNADGTLKYNPDPSCFATTATTEVKDDLALGTDGKPVSIIPCTNKCTFRDVFLLLNNFLTFFIKSLLIPIFIIMIMYAGYRYIAAGANGGAKANVKKMLGHVVLGIILILCSWLIVHTIMITVLNDEFKQSGIEFLGN